MRISTIAALALVALALCACGSASPASAPASPDAGAALQISGAWARVVAMPAMGADEQPTAAGAEHSGGHTAAMGDTNGAVYLTIRNTGSAPDRLVKASSAVARAVELHTVIKEGDVMQMRPVEAIEIPAGGGVELKPGGFHIMLIGVTQALKPGDQIDLTLQFEHGGTQSVQAEVRVQ